LRSSFRRIMLTSTALILAATVLLGLRVSGAGAQRPVRPAATTPEIAYFPDLQAHPTAAPHLGVAPRGQSGFGHTVVELQNRSAHGTTAHIGFTPKSSNTPIVLTRALGPHAAARVDTTVEKSVGAGLFSGELTADQPLGAIARIDWNTGARAAYEGITGATEVVAPLVTRDVYGHHSVLILQNADRTLEHNNVDLRIYDNTTGDVLKQVTLPMPIGGLTFYDTSWDARIFGPEVVGSNAPTGGWLGHVWFVAQQPVTVLVYGDENDGAGSMAYVGRSTADASTTQYLPLVRANYHGNSLIAVANASDHVVDVTIDYRGAAFSPSGAGQTFSQTFPISPRGSRFVDVSTRKRSTVDPPALPHGSSANRGFVGSAVVHATGPVMAVVQDEEVTGDRVDSIGAYNSAGPHDIGSAFGIPGWRLGVDGLNSTLLLQNPGTTDVHATIDLRLDADHPATRIESTVAAGSVSGIHLAHRPGFKSDTIYQALVTLDGAAAALLVDEPGSPQLAAPALWSGPDALLAGPVDEMIAAPIRLQVSASTPTPTATATGLSTPATATSTATATTPTSTAVTPPASRTATALATASPTATCIVDGCGGNTLRLYLPNVGR
jgi:hypothetical protein